MSGHPQRPMESTKTEIIVLTLLKQQKFWGIAISTEIPKVICNSSLGSWRAGKGIDG